MNKKYEFTGNKREILGKTVRQIRAIQDFGNIKAGERGGWIEKESNLSQADDCWVYYEACVLDNAMVYGNAQIREGAKVYDNAVVTDEAMVTEGAEVHGNAKIYRNTYVYNSSNVFGDAILMGDLYINDLTICGGAYIQNMEDIIIFDNIGKNRAKIIGFKSTMGCHIVVKDIFSGDVDDFLTFTKQTQTNPKYIKEYNFVAEIIKNRFESI